jgi:hypothetical protein
MTLRRVVLFFFALLLPSLADAQLIRRETIQPGIVFCDDAGANDTYTCPTPTPALAAYDTKILIIFKPNTNNTGAASLNVSGLGAITIVAFDGSTLANNALVAAQRYILVYNGTSFVLYNPGTGGTGLSGLTDDCFLKANGTTAAECSSAFDNGTGTYSYGTVSGNRYEFTYTAPTAVRTILWGDESGTPAFQKVKVSWDADAITQDGVLCHAPVTGQINGGPNTRWFLCDDSNSSIFEGKIVNLPYAITTTALTLKLNHATTETITFAGAFSAQCRAAGTTVNSTWGTAVNANVAITTANQPVEATAAAVIPNGTCSKNSTLFWRYVVNAASFSTNAANARIMGVYMAGE